MLKIKDNVDLSELEKFGFKYRPYPNKMIIYGKTIPAFENDINYLKVDIFVDEETREIRGEMTYRNSLKKYESIDGVELIFSTLFDLIQAGLVEEVQGWLQF